MHVIHPCTGITSISEIWDRVIWSLRDLRSQRRHCNLHFWDLSSCDVMLFSIACNSLCFSGFVTYIACPCFQNSHISYRGMMGINRNVNLLRSQNAATLSSLTIAINGVIYSCRHVATGRAHNLWSFLGSRDDFCRSRFTRSCTCVQPLSRWPLNAFFLRSLSIAWISFSLSVHETAIAVFGDAHKTIVCCLTWQASHHSLNKAPTCKELSLKQLKASDDAHNLQCGLPSDDMCASRNSTV